MTQIPDMFSRTPPLDIPTKLKVIFNVSVTINDSNATNSAPPRLASKVGTDRPIRLKKLIPPRVLLLVLPLAIPLETVLIRLPVLLVFKHRVITALHLFEVTSPPRLLLTVVSRLVPPFPPMVTLHLLRGIPGAMTPKLPPREILQVSIGQLLNMVLVPLDPITLHTADDRLMEAMAQLHLSVRRPVQDLFLDLAPVIMAPLLRLPQSATSLPPLVTVTRTLDRKQGPEKLQAVPCLLATDTFVTIILIRPESKVRNVVPKFNDRTAILNFLLRVTVWTSLTLTLATPLPL